MGEDHDSRRGLVRREEVVCETERKSPVDLIDIENLPMTAFERSRPVRAVRLSRLGTRRGCCKAEQPERRHGGDTAEKAAAGCNVGRMLIEIAHPVPPSHVAMDDHAISDETGQVLGAGPVELARVRNLYSELDTALASLKHIQEQIIEREFAP